METYFPNQRSRMRYCGLVISLLILMSLPLMAEAADFRVSPMLQEIVIRDEQAITTEVTLTNTTTLPATFRVMVYDFGSLDESGGVAFLGASQVLDRRYTLAAWMKPGEEEITLQPGESHAVSVVIENKETLGPGGHYGAVVFQLLKDSNAAPTDMVAIQQMLASLIFAKKIGGAEPGLELTNVHPSLRWFRHRTTELRFQNPGNVHVVPRGTVELVDPIGRLVEKGVVNEASAIVFPEDARLFLVKLRPIVRAWVPGWYTLFIQYRYHENMNPEQWKQRVFLIPESLLWVGLGGVTLILGKLYLKRRKK